MNSVKPVRGIRGTKNRILRFIVPVCLTALLALFLCSCGSRRNDEIMRYGDSMSVFFNKLSGYDSELSSIDPSDPDASGRVLSVIDEIAAECDWAASLDVPEGFETAGSLTKEVNDNIQFARLEYHKAFEADPFGEESYAKASEYYETAGEKLRELLDCLKDAP